MQKVQEWMRRKRTIGLCSIVLIVVSVTWIVVLVQAELTKAGYGQSRKTWKMAEPTPIRPPKNPPLEVPCSPLSEWEYTRFLDTNRTIRPATVVYSFAIHHNFHHFKDWMDVMWEPQHFFIIHIDSKSPPEFYFEVQDYASKFKNVYINEERYNVVYYGWSVLWTHLHNFKRVIQLNQTRDYFVNMAGSDMPIKTPREINYFLGEHMGRSFFYEHCTWPYYRQWWRNYTWAEIGGTVEQVNNQPKFEPPSLELKWGQHYVILHRDVVHWMFSDPRIYHFIGWLQNVKSPDEMFYATMLLNSPWAGTDRIFTHNNFKYATWGQCCSGSVLTAGHPCVLGVCDLPVLESLNHLWATKIDATIDPRLTPQLKKIIALRKQEEESTGRVRRIPLNTEFPLVPEYITWRKKS